MFGEVKLSKKFSAKEREQMTEVLRTSLQILNEARAKFGWDLSEATQFRLETISLIEMIEHNEVFKKEDIANLVLKLDTTRKLTTTIWNYSEPKDELEPIVTKITEFLNDVIPRLAALVLR